MLRSVAATVAPWVPAESGRRFRRGHGCAGLGDLRILQNEVPLLVRELRQELGQTSLKKWLWKPWIPDRRGSGDVDAVLREDGEPV